MLGWIAAEVVHKAIGSKRRDELATFEEACGGLADYLRMPNTDLSLLMPWCSTISRCRVCAGRSCWGSSSEGRRRLGIELLRAPALPDRACARKPSR